MESYSHVSVECVVMLCLKRDQESIGCKGCRSDALKRQHRCVHRALAVKAADLVAIWLEALTSLCFSFFYHHRWTSSGTQTHVRSCTCRSSKHWTSECLSGLVAVSTVFCLFLIVQTCHLRLTAACVHTPAGTCLRMMAMQKMMVMSRGWH